MSGIVALLNLDGGPVDAQTLQRMTESLRFRGADALTTQIAGPAGLGNALFRTTDESARESQPFSVEGKTWITADARVDDRAGLIRELGVAAEGHLEAAPDAELILRAYGQWGADCVHHLLGDFAFIIWDGVARRLFCARDHFGIKPFYYAQRGNTFIASNTLDCLRMHPAISENLNERAIGDFLLFGFNRETDTTAFADVRRLPPAHTLTASAEGVAVRRFWTLPEYAVPRYQKEEDVLDDFRELLDAAVQDRLRTQPVAVFMSGGLDSTSVAAVATRLLRPAPGGEAGGVRAFTVVFQDLFADDEGRWAGAAAQALGIPVRCMPLRNCGLYQGWDRPDLRKPEPAHEPLSAFEWEFYTEAAGYSRVALAGEGGDVLLHSQSWPYLTRLLKRGQWVRLAREVGGHVLRHGRIPPPLAGFRSRWGRVLGKNREAAVPGWLAPAFARRLDLAGRWQEFLHPAEAPQGLHPAACAALQGNFFPALFESQDPGSTRVPLEVRLPLFDVRLVRWALALPALPWCVDKALLRAAMRGTLPEAVRLRRKTPLAADPIRILLERDKFGAAQFPMGPEIASFVVPQKIAADLEGGNADHAMIALRAISLSFWLQAARRAPKADLGVAIGGVLQYKSES